MKKYFKKLIVLLRSFLSGKKASKLKLSEY